MYGGPRVPNVGPTRSSRHIRAASRSIEGEDLASIRSLRDEFNSKVSDTTLQLKECIDEERLVRTKEASVLTQSLHRSLEAGLSAEGQVRERVLEALQRDMEALRQELQQGLRTVATVLEDVEVLRHDLLAVTLNLASTKPLWQRDLEAVRQEAMEERSKIAATGCHTTKVDAMEALLAQHVQMLNKVQMVQQVQQKQLRQEEETPQHGNPLWAMQLTLPLEFRAAPDTAACSHGSAGAGTRGAGVSGGLQLEEEELPIGSEPSPHGEPPLYESGQDAGRVVRIEERSDRSGLPRRSEGVTSGFWGTCVSGVPTGGARA